jgi:hypothetical protein
LTNCVSANGTPLGVEARNTAVPGGLASHRLTAVSIRSSSGCRNVAQLGAGPFDQLDAVARLLPLLL